MIPEGEELARFVIGVKLIKGIDGALHRRIELGGNKIIPIEIILEQLRAFIRVQEERYLKNFKNNSSEFKGSN